MCNRLSDAAIDARIAEHPDILDAGALVAGVLESLGIEYAGCDGCEAGDHIRGRCVAAVQQRTALQGAYAAAQLSLPL
jgi:hypothetical protein